MKKTLGLFLAMIMMVSFLAGCTPKKDEVKDIDLKDIHEAVKESLGEDYFPNREMELEELESFTGIKEEDIDSYIAEAPMISVQIDTFIAIKAKEGKGDNVEAGLESYRKYLVEDSLQYPMNLAKVNSAKVVRHGDYIFFLMLGRVNENMEATEEEALEFAELEVEKIEKVIDEFFK